VTARDAGVDEFSGAGSYRLAATMAGAFVIAFLGASALGFDALESGRGRLVIGVVAALAILAAFASAPRISPVQRALVGTAVTSGLLTLGLLGAPITLLLIPAAVVAAMGTLGVFESDRVGRGTYLMGALVFGGVIAAILIALVPW
jgi:hypothetical protein